jgi:acetyl esterase/lipase
MKKLFYLVCSLFLLSACQKEAADNSTGISLTAQTKLDVAYGSDTAQKMDIYLPAGRSADSTKVIVLIHGGAWAEGDKNEFTPYVDSLQRRLSGYAVFNVNYRLAALPFSNPFPAQETDIKTAMNFIAAHLSEYNVSNKLVLLGASAGGHLALLQAYKNAVPAVKAVVDFFGPVDMTDLYNTTTDPTTKLGLQLLLNGTPTTNAALYQSSSPITYVKAGVPPTIILHGDADPLVPIAQSQKLETALKAAGVTVQFVRYPGEGHGWFGAKLSDSFDKIGSFLKANVQ